MTNNTSFEEIWVQIAVNSSKCQYMTVGGVGGFSKVVATFNHVGVSFNHLWPPPGVFE